MYSHRGDFSLKEEIHHSHPEEIHYSHLEEIHPHTQRRFATHTQTGDTLRHTHICSRYSPQTRRRCKHKRLDRRHTLAHINTGNIVHKRGAAINTNTLTGDTHNLSIARRTGEIRHKY